MEPKDEWVFFREIDWECPKNNKFNVDTRDFHCGYLWDDIGHEDFDKLKKYSRFFLSKEELVDLLERYYLESGGEGEWRYFTLNHNDSRVLYWNMKYIRIYRTELGFIVCNSNEKAILKDILMSEVELEHLNHIKK